MILAVDTENTTWNKGSPFDTRNFNVCISTAYRDSAGDIQTGVFFPEQRENFRRLFEQAECLVGFNLKYDLHWLKKLGFEVGERRVYDCQIAEYVLGWQQTAYPSLNLCAEKHLGEVKIDEVERDYWDKGINTDAVPRAVLARYAAKDAELTLRLYEFYSGAVPEPQRRLLNLRMQDLLGLQEMEYNGIKFDRAEVTRRASEAEREIEEIKGRLDVHHNVPGFKWTSNAHLSALLYGGTIEEWVRVPDGTLFKSGQRKGEPRLRKVLREHFLPRRYKPIKGSETANEGQWSVAEEYLVQLKGGGALIEGILRIKELEKLNSTYLSGMLEKYEERHLTDDTLHGQFNQCVTDTTRLSSSNPNLQNIAGNVKGIFKSRYEY
jgi:DNA polymerase-1